MWWKIKIPIVFFLLSGFALSQETKIDSVKNIYSFDPLLKLQASFEEFDFYRELNYTRFNLEANNDSNTIWMWTKLSIANSGRTDFHAGESPVDMIEPLRQEFRENSKLNPIKYVLGVAQTAAVGYLAYRHIKKFGLFK